LTGGTVH